MKATIACEKGVYDVELPHYCKGGCSFFKVYSQEYAIRVSTGHRAESAEIGFVHSGLPFEAYDEKLETITEQQYKEAYNLALNNINQY